MPTVSVIIPNYNHAPYLEQRINTVLGQTFQDMEVIILDDCSKDNSREIIKKYESDPRVRLAFNESNSGCVFKQWNKGLKMASGKYVWIAESDDYSATDFLETLVKCLEKEDGAGVAFSDSFEVCNGTIRPARDVWYGEFAPLYGQDFKMDGRQFAARQMLFKNMIPNASAAVFRRSLAEQIGGADESFRLCGDWDFWVRLLSVANLAYLATPFNYYRRHEQTVRHVSVANGIFLEEASRISLYLLKNFSVSPPDAKKIRDYMTDWFLCSLTAVPCEIPTARRRNIRHLMYQLNPGAIRRLWYMRSGLQWLWLGCRRRMLAVWKRLFHASGSVDVSRR